MGTYKMLVVDNSFVAEHKPLIRHLVVKRLGGASRDEVADLTADTIVKCITNARYYNAQWSVNTFIGLQVRSAVQDYMMLRQAQSQDALGVSVGLMEDHDAPVAEEETDYETMYFLQQRLQPYLHVLSDNERDVIIQFVWGRRGVNNTADRLGLHPSTVSVVKKRARRKLHQAWQEGRRVNPAQEVDADVPLETAIKLLPDAQYHSYRLHHLKGWPLGRIASIMGCTIFEVSYLIDEAKFNIQQKWGYRA